MALPELHTQTLLESVPPWLTRAHGARLLRALGSVLDAVAVRVVRAVRTRFPSASSPEALARIGAERRILRGPGESAETYAPRLLPWWPAHRGRGGPYELLRQFRAYLAALHPTARIDVVYHSGTRRWIDSAGTITRDAITWSVVPNGRPAEWSHVWVVVHLDAEPIVETPLLTDTGEQLVTGDGTPIVAGVGVSVAGALPTEQAEIYRALPREWSAAHVPFITVVLLYGLGDLWDYPAPVGTWDEWESTTATFDADLPVVLTTE